MEFIQLFQQDINIPAQSAVQTKLTLLDLTIKGGWVMIPIIFLSFVAAYIFIERYFVSS